MTAMLRARGALASRLLDTHVEDWRAQAACIDKDPELWFALTADTEAEAIRICQEECPVITICRRWADEHGVADGVWGGLTAAERRGQALAQSRMRQRNCQRCSAPFTAQRAQFCSKQCRDWAAHAKRSTWTPERRSA